MGGWRVRSEGGLLICRSARRSGGEHGSEQGSEYDGVSEHTTSVDGADEQANKGQHRPPCCFPLDRECTLPCPVGDSHRKVRICERGMLALNGSVCLPLECRRPQDAVDAACGTEMDTAAALGTAASSSVAAPFPKRGQRLRCCAAHVRRHGPVCCEGHESGCAVPRCTSRPSELCASGIRAMGGRVCLPFRCRVDDPTFCSERSPFPPNRASEWTPGKRPPRTCCAEALWLFFAQTDARRAKASPAELERADELLQGHDCCYPTDTACRLPNQ